MQDVGPVHRLFIYKTFKGKAVYLLLKLVYLTISDKNYKNYKRKKKRSYRYIYIAYNEKLLEKL